MLSTARPSCYIFAAVAYPNEMTEDSSSAASGGVGVDVAVYSSFDAWSRGQPDNSYQSAGRTPYQSCNALHITDSSTFGWNDQHCAATSFWTRHRHLYGHLCRYGNILFG